MAFTIIPRIQYVFQYVQYVFQRPLVEPRPTPFGSLVAFITNIKPLEPLYMELAPKIPPFFPKLTLELDSEL
jgi:hypothetical protein